MVSWLYAHAGIWGLGLANRSCNLHKVPLGTDTSSWVLRHDGVFSHNSEEVGRIEELPQEGDIIVSCFYWCHRIVHISATVYGNSCVWSRDL